MDDVGVFVSSILPQRHFQHFTWRMKKNFTERILGHSFTFSLLYCTVCYMCTSAVYLTATSVAKIKSCWILHIASSNYKTIITLQEMETQMGYVYGVFCHLGAWQHQFPFLVWENVTSTFFKISFFFCSLEEIHMGLEKQPKLIRILSFGWIIPLK